MSNDPLRYVSPGEKLPGLPAESWNLAMDAARFVRDTQSRLGGEAEAGERQSGIVKVLNDSGAAVERFGSLKVAAPIIYPAGSLGEYQRGVFLRGEVPESGETRLAVAIEPMPAAGIGRAVISGAAVALVYVRSSTHEYARAGGVTGYLVSDTTGPVRILYAPSYEVGVGTPVYGSGSGSGSQVGYVTWAYVLLGAAGTGGGCSTTLTFVTSVCRRTQSGSGSGSGSGGLADSGGGPP